MRNERRKRKPPKNTLSETEYLLSSPNNARRLMEAIKESREGKGERMSVEELRRKVGLDS